MFVIGPANTHLLSGPAGMVFEIIAAAPDGLSRSELDEALLVSGRSPDGDALEALLSGLQRVELIVPCSQTA